MSDCRVPMPTYEPTWKRVSEGYNVYSSFRKVYEVTPPVIYKKGCATSYVLADYSITLDCGPETMIFPCTKEGEVLDWSDPFVCWRDGVSDDSAIAEWCLERGEIACQNSDKQTAARADAEVLASAGQDKKTSVFELGV